MVHDEDGDWQFLTGDQLQKDARIVCLEDLVLRDQTLNDTFNLDYGESAERNFVGYSHHKSSFAGHTHGYLQKLGATNKSSLAVLLSTTYPADQTQMSKRIYFQLL